MSKEALMLHMGRLANEICASFDCSMPKIPLWTPSSPGKPNVVFVMYVTLEILIRNVLSNDDRRVL